MNTGTVIRCNCHQDNGTREETRKGKYPPSKHDPSCVSYRAEEFVRVEYDGETFIIELHEAQKMLSEPSKETYFIETINLTRDQFERLQEVMEG